MRLKRLMSIVLAVALVLSFAMSASATTTLYLSEDFDYATFDAWRAAVPLWDGVTATGDIEGRFTLLDFEALRAAGTTALLSHSYGINDSVVSIISNSNGNNMVSATNAGYAQSVAYIPSLSWNIANNPTQKYVISYDIAAPVAGAGMAGRSYQYVHGVSDAGALVKTQIVSSADARLVANTSAMYTGTDLVFEDDTARRFAHGFYYDTAAGTVVKVAADNGVFGSSGSYQTEGLTTIDAFVYNIHNNATRIAKLRMYTIDTVEGFKVTSDIDGTEVSDLSSKTITLTFTQPVCESTFDETKITLTANGAPASIEVGTLTTGVVNGSYVSTVDVTLPALAEETNYVLTVADAKNELGDALVDATVEFSTPYPDGPVIPDAPGGSDFVVDSITPNTHVAGSMGTVDVVVTNNESANKNIAVIYAVYSSTGTLVDVVYANDSLTPASTTTISAGVKLSDDAAKAKVMIWDGLNTINPLNGFTSVEVTAAAQ